MLENVKMESSAHLYIKNKQKTPKLKQFFMYNSTIYLSRMI